MRKLAEEAQSAAETISRLVSEIQGGNERAAVVVKEVPRRPRRAPAFEEIGGAINTMRGRVEEIV